VAADSKKHVRAIAEALKTDDVLILATDPDREGEAISWHLQEALASSIKKGKRSAASPFNAITKDAVTEAMKAPRQVDMPLVEAYLGAACPGLSGGLQPLARAVAQAARIAQRGARAIGLPASDR
jgi:DNA topoisomerase IA